MMDADGTPVRAKLKQNEQRSAAKQIQQNNNAPNPVATPIPQPQSPKLSNKTHKKYELNQKGTSKEGTDMDAFNDNVPEEEINSNVTVNATTNDITNANSTNSPPIANNVMSMTRGVNVNNEIKCEVATDEARKTEELYRKVRGVLNKLTPQKFDTLFSQIKGLEINTPSRLQGVIDLLFEKAVDEPNFLVAYALMCKELTLMQVTTNKSTEEKLDYVNFRKLLITRCQVEIEKLKEIEECTDPEKEKDLQFDLEEYDRKLRMKSVGNKRFIGADGYPVSTPPGTYVPTQGNQGGIQGSGLRGMAPTVPPNQASTPPIADIKVQSLSQQSFINPSLQN